MVLMRSRHGFTDAVNLTHQSLFYSCSLVVAQAYCIEDKGILNVILRHIVFNIVSVSRPSNSELRRPHKELMKPLPTSPHLLRIAEVNPKALASVFMNLSLNWMCKIISSLLLVNGRRRMKMIEIYGAPLHHQGKLFAALLIR